MIDYTAALARMINAARPLAAESVPLLAALGRVSAESLKSPMQSPPFNNSAMDGFALKAEETSSATLQQPLYFKIQDLIAAGHTGHYHGEKTAIKIMTGAPVPPGYNTVLVIEEATIIDIDHVPHLRVTTPLPRHQHIREAGEDIAQQDELIAAGERFNAYQLMTLATVGLHTVSVKRTPTICMMCTGDEIIDNDGQALTESRIYNSNAPFLIGALQTAGLQAHYAGLFSDDPTAYRAMLENLLGHVDNCSPHPTSRGVVGEEKKSQQTLAQPQPPEIIISTGAVSKGDYDFIPSVLRDLGAEFLFHGVKMRPGKPILMAKLGSCYYFGLAGNPAAVAVGYQFFVLPFLRALQGLSAECPLRAKLMTSTSKKEGFTQFLKAYACLDAQACLCVSILPGQASFSVKPFLKANAWVIAEENTSELKAGSLVPLVLTGPLTVAGASDA